MKIVHICIANYYADGYGYQENLLTKYNKIQGNDVTIITSVRNYSPETGDFVYENPRIYKNNEGIKVIRLQYRFKFFGKKIMKTIGSTKKFYYSLKNEKPDMIFSHNLNFLDILFVKHYVKRHKKIIWFVDNHGDYVNTGKTFFSLKILHGTIWKTIIKSCDKYISKYYGVLPIRNKFLKEVYQVPENKIDLLFMGADDEELESALLSDKFIMRKNYDIPEDAFVIVTGGKIDLRKNIHILLEAFSGVKKDNIYLIVFGTVTNEMKSKIEEYKSCPRIVFTGWMNQEDIYRLFLSADLAIFPGTHSVLWEQACAAGVPCVFKYWEGITHVDVNNNCILLKEISCEILAETINSLVNDVEKYAQLKYNAKGSAHKNFLYSEISKKLMNDYSNCLKYTLSGKDV